MLARLFFFFTLEDMVMHLNGLLKATVKLILIRPYYLVPDLLQIQCTESLSSAMRVTSFK